MDVFKLVFLPVSKVVRGHRVPTDISAASANARVFAVKGTDQVVSVDALIQARSFGADHLRLAAWTTPLQHTFPHIVINAHVHRQLSATSVRHNLKVALAGAIVVDRAAIARLGQHLLVLETLHLLDARLADLDRRHAVVLDQVVLHLSNLFVVNSADSKCYLRFIFL